jgi:thiosulfate dehydrogenase (quinone) large subunit
MSSRDRARHRGSPRGPEYVVRPGAPAPTVGPSEGLWADTGSRSGISPLALLPLRVFLGVTFLYAGLDKLLDPAFLNASGPGSIGAQMVAFAHNSPLAPLVVVFGEPFPIAVGLGISLAEIAVGLGALTGLLFRASAALGAALAIMFWLTASWAVKPYYYGPDLPYAFGWITLALAGTGGMFTMAGWLATPGPSQTPRELERLRLATAHGRPVPTPAEDMTRRALLEAGVLAGVAILLASAAGLLGPMLRGRAEGRSALTSPGPDASQPSDALTAPAPSAAASAEASAGPAAAAATPAAPAGTVIGSMSHLTHDRPLGFADPTTGDPSAVLLLPSGKVVAFDLTCTHAGCEVEYDPSSTMLICPCHGATFDPKRGARAVAGPTDQPLTALPIHVDPATGQITLRT